MSNYLIIWGVVILILSPFLIYHYQKKPDDRLSWLATALILILWPLTLISMVFLFGIVWVEERLAKDKYDYEYKKGDHNE